MVGVEVRAKEGLGVAEGTAHGIPVIIVIGQGHVEMHKRVDREVVRRFENLQVLPRNDLVHVGINDHGVGIHILQSSEAHVSEMVSPCPGVWMALSSLVKVMILFMSMVFKAWPLFFLDL